MHRETRQPWHHLRDRSHPGGSSPCSARSSSSSTCSCSSASARAAASRTGSQPEARPRPGRRHPGDARGRDRADGQPPTRASAGAGPPDHREPGQRARCRRGRGGHRGRPQHRHLRARRERRRSTTSARPAELRFRKVHQGDQRRAGRRGRRAVGHARAPAPRPAARAAPAAPPARVRGADAPAPAVRAAARRRPRPTAERAGPGAQPRRATPAAPVPQDTADAARRGRGEGRRGRLGRGQRAAGAGRPDRRPGARRGARAVRDADPGARSTCCRRRCSSTCRRSPATQLDKRPPGSIDDVEAAGRRLRERRSKYLLDVAKVDGTDVGDATAQLDPRPGRSGWSASTSPATARSKWTELTREAFNNAGRRRASQAAARRPDGNCRVAVVLDNTVVSAPADPGRADQRRRRSPAASPRRPRQQLANQLKYGALPLTFEQARRAERSPRRWAPSYLRAGLLAAGIGMLLVVDLRVLLLPAARLGHLPEPGPVRRC